MKVTLIIVLITLFSLGCSGKNPYQAFREHDTGGNNLTRSKDLVKLTRERSFYLTQETKFQERASKKWEADAKVASRYEYVKYSKDFKARASINFQTGLIRVETTAVKHPKTILAKAIRTTLLNPMNPATVDLFSDRDKVQKGIPFLYKRVLDHEGQPIRWTWRAYRFAQYLIDKDLQTDTIQTASGTKKRFFVTFNMKAPHHYSHNNAPYRRYVTQYAKRYGISEALILGIIQTESHFNPFAISPIPAFGLMQIVPSSAGADAWSYVKHRKGRPSRNYLFNPKNNIELGTAYMRLLFRHYLVKIKDLKSREYCAIAAYNTGAGNVLRTFSKDREKAFARINRMHPKAVYSYLKNHLPHKETRRYLVKVSKAKNAFY